MSNHDHRSDTPASEKAPPDELTPFQAKWLERQLALINKPCIGACGIKPTDRF